MCKCISEIEKKALELKYKEQSIQKARFISGAFVMSDGFKLKACGEMELTVEGRKSPSPNK